MIQIPFRAAKLVATFHMDGASSDEVYAHAECGDLRIEIEVPWDVWPASEDDFGTAETAEIELT